MCLFYVSSQKELNANHLGEISVQYNLSLKGHSDERTTCDQEMFYYNFVLPYIPYSIFLTVYSLPYAEEPVMKWLETSFGHHQIDTMVMVI